MGKHLKREDGLVQEIKELRDRIVELKEKEVAYKKTKSALTQSKTRYQTVFESANDAIFLVHEYRFVECNKKTLEIFGCDRKEQIIGKFFYELSTEYQANGALSKDEGVARARAVAKGKPQIFDWRHCKLDMTPFDTEVSLNHIELDGGIYILAVVRDISARKHAEARLKKAFQEISQLKKQLELDNIYLREEIKLEHNFEEIIGNSDAIKYSLFRVEQASATDTTVLIQGETGTGKGLFARAIHHASPRKNRPLIVVNCAALPSNLVESELFGHEKGAFTGAAARQIGRFEIAHGATIFLDEIGELSLPLQAKLLRVLQDGEFERIGSAKTLKTDARVITATNRSLEDETQAGRFRKDLWYRLNVFPITIPPLRDRKEDIPMLVSWFVKKFSTRMGKKIQKIPQNVIKTLQDYDWPGNVRELENVLERSVIITQAKKLNLDMPQPSKKINYKDQSLDSVQKKHIKSVLKRTGGRIRGKNGAAEILELKPTTLASKMKKLSIKRLGSRNDI